MANEPAYGCRASPEELAQIRREQGLDQDDQPARSQPVSPSTGLGQGPKPTRAPHTNSVGSPRQRRWWMLLVGLVMMLVVPMLLLVASTWYVMGGDLSSVTTVPQSGSVYLAQGSEVAVYSSQVGMSTDQCEVVGPDGAGVDTSSTPSFPYATFTAPASGLYQVSCPGAPASTRLMVGPAVDLSRAWVMAVGVLLAVLVGLVGIGLSVAGAVRAWRGQA